jgi:hypothetical protein
LLAVVEVQLMEVDMVGTEVIRMDFEDVITLQERVHKV